MKKTLTVIMAIAGIAVFTDRAGAIISPPALPDFQDIDEFGVILNATQSAGDVFNLITGDGDSITIGGGYLNAGSTYTDISGFVPGAGKVILSAYAYFYLSGISGDITYTINLSDWVNAGEEGTPAQFIIPGALGSAAITVLNNSGMLAYTVKCDDGSFTFDYAQLQVDLTGDASPSVPDGGSSAGMLGFAFLAVGVAARKLNTRKA